MGLEGGVHDEIIDQQGEYARALFHWVCRFYAWLRGHTRELSSSSFSDLDMITAPQRMLTVNVERALTSARTRRSDRASGDHQRWRRHLSVDHYDVHEAMAISSSPCEFIFAFEVPETLILLSPSNDRYMCGAGRCLTFCRLLGWC